jgi:site-specific DNA-methyltransferase (cytosine-N4-specific)
VLDPFCGSGSVLVEAKALCRSSCGIDLNPLALLVARVKTTALPIARLYQEYYRLLERLERLQNAELPGPDFFNVDFWFKPEVVSQLARLKAAIDALDGEETAPIRDFFLVAFSESVRLSSNSRSHEFKLFRYSPDRLARHNPDVFAIFRLAAEKNITRMSEFVKALDGCDAPVRLLQADSTLPPPEIPAGSIDVVVTSPPYGDSRTTVAYGQFSRLSAQWLGLHDEETTNLDTRLMGGHIARSLPVPPSFSLQESLDEIAGADPRRARHVLSFYSDYNRALGTMAGLVRRGGYICIVIGNRRVKRIQLPTDLITAELGASVGLETQQIIARNIPHKRMPLSNSPTNKAGELEKTMSKEYIVVMRKG